MPAKFDRCANKEGAKMRRVSGPDKEHGLAAGEYVTYCIDPDTGKSVRGYVRQAKDTGLADAE